MTTPTPIKIHIPPSLTMYAKSASVYTSDQPDLDVVGVGGLIFATPPGSQVHILLVKRAEDGYSAAGKWEPPGGGCEDTDPTMIHSTAREVFEEAGLHLTGVTDMVGEYRFRASSGGRCVKFNFVIQVQEITGASTKLEDIPVEIDPAEHQDFAWVNETSLTSGEYTITCDEQLEAIREGFRLQKKRTGSSSSIAPA